MSKALKTLSQLAGSVLATDEAEAADHTAAEMRIEDSRYERAVLDFEAAVRRERDRMSAVHLENQRTILAEAAE